MLPRLSWVVVGLLGIAVRAAVAQPTVSPEFELGDPRAGPPAGQQLAPAVAFGGADYFAVWMDFRYRRPDDGLGGDLYGTRVDRTGVVVDPAGIHVAADAEFSAPPGVAFDGRDYVTAWLNVTDGMVDVARISPGGVLLDPAAIAVSSPPSSEDRTGYNAPLLACGDADCLAVWRTWVVTGPYVDPWGSSWLAAARVSPDGTVLDLLSLSHSVAQPADAAVASGGTKYLVAWTDPTGFTVRGTRVETTDRIQDIVASDSGPLYGPAVASDGDGWLVVWTTGTWASFNGVHGARVASDGTVLDPSGIDLCTATSHQSAPAVAYDGANYLVVWRDSRNDPGGMRWDLYGTWVSRAGEVLQPEGVPISTDAADEGAPALASDGSGQSLVVYDLSDPAAPLAATRVRARLIGPHGPAGSACSADADCESSSCVGGVCCDSASGGEDPGDCRVDTADVGADTTTPPESRRSGVSVSGGGCGCRAASSRDGRTLLVLLPLLALRAGPRRDPVLLRARLRRGLVPVRGERGPGAPERQLGARHRSAVAPPVDYGTV
ncbi:MAG: hypothetical protein HY905_17520 [Deltaproteobacteria bacterium]|nr:hypothetical protein [Deltaproteobacteria bacterium]